MVERNFRMFGNFNPSEFPGRIETFVIVHDNGPSLIDSGDSILVFFYRLKRN